MQMDMSKGTIYEQLRKRIVTGQVTSGQVLSEGKAAALLGVSRGAVRSTLQRLEAEGLLRPRGRKRVRVVGEIYEETPRNVLKRYELRQYIESAAAGLAARYMSGIEIEHLLVLAERLAKLSKSREYAARHKASWEFHEYLMSRCGNEALFRIWKSERLRPVVLPSPEREDEMFRNLPAMDRDGRTWSEVAEAIAAHDSERAEALVKKAVGRVVEALREALWAPTGETALETAQADKTGP